MLTRHLNLRFIEFYNVTIFKFKEYLVIDTRVQFGPRIDEFKELSKEDWITRYPSTKLDEAGRRFDLFLFPREEKIGVIFSFPLLFFRHSVVRQRDRGGGWGELVRLSTPFHRVLSWPLKGQPREGRIGICYPFEHSGSGKKRRATGEGSLVKRWKGTPVRHCLSGWTVLIFAHLFPTMKTCARLQGTLVRFFWFSRLPFFLLSWIEPWLYCIFLKLLGDVIKLDETTLDICVENGWKLTYLSEFLNFKCRAM